MYMQNTLGSEEVRLKLRLCPALDSCLLLESVPIHEPWTKPCADIYKRSAADYFGFPLRGGGEWVRLIHIHGIGEKQSAVRRGLTVRKPGSEVHLSGKLAALQSADARNRVR